jgi:hypothetical protein
MVKSSFWQGMSLDGAQSAVKCHGETKWVKQSLGFMQEVITNSSLQSK